MGPLLELQKRLDESLSSIGFERERRPFKAHLTMGRVKSNRNSRALMTMLKECEPVPLAFNVSEIVLIRSELHPAGSRYTQLASATLQK